MLLATCSVGNVIANEEIKIEDFWINEAPPVSRVHAAYLHVYNQADNDAVLNSIESPAYARVEIHQSIVSDDRVRMQAHDKLAIPSRSNLEFKPGGFHLMLFDPVNKLQAGDEVKFTFYLEDGRQHEASATVKKFDGAHMHHHH